MQTVKFVVFRRKRFAHALTVVCCCIGIVALSVFVNWNLVSDSGGEAPYGLLLIALLAAIASVTFGGRKYYEVPGTIKASENGIRVVVEDAAYKWGKLTPAVYEAAAPYLILEKKCGFEIDAVDETCRLDHAFAKSVCWQRFIPSKHPLFSLTPDSWREFQSALPKMRCSISDQN